MKNLGLGLAKLEEKVMYIEKKFAEDINMLNTRIDKEIAQISESVKGLYERIDATNEAHHLTIISMQRWFIGGVCAVLVQMVIAFLQLW